VIYRVTLDSPHKQEKIAEAGLREARFVHASAAFLLSSALSLFLFHDYDELRSDEEAFFSRKSHKCHDHTNLSAKMISVPAIMVIPIVGTVWRRWFPAQNSSTRTISRNQPRAISDLTRAHLNSPSFSSTTIPCGLRPPPAAAPAMSNPATPGGMFATSNVVPEEVAG